MLECRVSELMLAILVIGQYWSIRKLKIHPFVHTHVIHVFSNLKAIKRMVSSYLCLTVLFLTAVFASIQSKFIESAVKNPPPTSPRSPKTRQQPDPVASHRHQSMSKRPLLPTKKENSGRVPKSHRKKQIPSSYSVIIFKNKHVLPACHSQFTILPEFYTVPDLALLFSVCKYFCIKFKDRLNLEKRKLHQVIRRFVNAKYVLDTDAKYAHPREKFSSIEVLIEEYSVYLKDFHLQLITSNHNKLIISFDHLYSKMRMLFMSGSTAIRFLVLGYCKTTGWNIREFKKSRDTLMAKMLTIQTIYKDFLKKYFAHRFLLRLARHEKVNETLFARFSREMKARRLPFCDYVYTTELLFVCTILPIKQILFWDIFHIVEFIAFRYVVSSIEKGSHWSHAVVNDCIKKVLELSHDIRRYKYIVKVAFEILKFTMDGFFSIKEIEKTCDNFRTYLLSIKRPIERFLIEKIYARTRIALLA